MSTQIVMLKKYILYIIFYKRYWIKFSFFFHPQRSFPNDDKRSGWRLWISYCGPLQQKRPGRNNWRCLKLGDDNLVIFSKWWSRNQKHIWRTCYGYYVCLYKNLSFDTSSWDKTETSAAYRPISPGGDSWC